jgi:hypothetical protein
MSFPALDISHLSATYVTQFQIPVGRVMQSFDIDPGTGQYYVSQIATRDNEHDGTRIFRCAADGSLIDSALLRGAGHGSSITLERDERNVYIWTWWFSDTTGKGADHTPVRWQYDGAVGDGKDVLRGDPTVHKLPVFWKGYTLYAIDAYNDRIAIRNHCIGRETFQLRKLSEFKKGVDNIIYGLGPLERRELGAFQGFQTIDGKLYVAWGGTHGGPPPHIGQYDWDGRRADLVDTTLYVHRPYGRLGSHNEAEGLAVRRSASGKPSLLFGKATGPVHMRRSTVWEFTDNN